jgi:hypothetical protein
LRERRGISIKEMVGMVCGSRSQEIKKVRRGMQKTMEMKRKRWLKEMGREACWHE